MRYLLRYVMHALHDRLCPCEDIYADYWECSDCGTWNHPRHEWCQVEECRSPSPTNPYA